MIRRSSTAPSGRLCFVALTLVLTLATSGISSGQQAGSKLWQFPIKGECIYPPALGSDATIYVGSFSPPPSSEAILFALTPAGTEKWRVQLDFAPNGIPTSVGSDGTIYAGGYGFIYAVGPDGVSRWRSSAQCPSSTNPTIGSDGVIYTSGRPGGGGCNLFAFLPDGTNKWSRGIWGIPSLGLDGRLYGNGLSLNPDGSTNQLIGSLGSAPTLGLNGDIYSVIGTNLFSLSSGGTTNWVFHSPLDITSSPSLAADQTIYLGIASNLVALDAAGVQKWVFETRGAVRSSPAISADGMIYVGSEDKSLYAVAADGTKRWEFATAGAIRSPPAIGADGTVYIVSADGNLYAIKGTVGLANSPWPKFRGNARNTGNVADSPSDFSQPPSILGQPLSVFRRTSENATFSVTTDGYPPLHYQWHNGTGILANATNSSLTITNAQADASYYVVVSNSYGSVTSRSAQLKILVNYTTAVPAPISPTPPPPPPKPPNQHNLVVVTHGWDWSLLSDFNTDAPQWVYDMTDSIRNNLPDSSWTVFALSWKGLGGATTPYPGQAASRAETIGKKFGLGISAQGWSHVHFIGHSAGAVLIQTAAEELIANSASPVVIHTTFLDPYDWSRFGGPSRFGAGSGWSDNYFETDLSGPLTGGRLDHPYNVDISALDPHPIYHPADEHGWAYEFYQKTITGDLGSISEGFGFPLSKEGGNWNYAINTYLPGNCPYLLGGGSALCSSSVPIQSNPNIVVSALSALWSGTVYVTYNGIDLYTSLFSPLKSEASSAASFGSPVWLSLGVSVTNRINFVRFDAGFTSATNAAGLLTVYWNTNEIGVLDETVTTPGLHN